MNQSLFIKNTLCLQCSKCCYCFDDVLWPEFSFRHLFYAIMHYQRNYYDIQVTVFVFYCNFFNLKNASSRLQKIKDKTKPEFDTNQLKLDAYLKFVQLRQDKALSDMLRL